MTDDIMLDDPTRGFDAFGRELSDDDWLLRLRGAVAPPELGRFGPYELLGEVTRGAQGIVYRARDIRSSRVVALKRIAAGRLASPRQQRRFERELEATADLRHPNIVSIRHHDIVDGQPILVMDWIEGVTLDRWLRAGGGPRSMEVRLAVFRGICDAIAYAHRRGVIHRDLKPGNVLIDAREHPHVLDFGLAILAAETPEASRLTSAGEFVGTPVYAAPEQINGEPTAIDVRTDVYALGVMLYEMLTGRPPHSTAAGLPALFDAIRTREPPPPSGASCEIDVDLDAIVLKALSKRPAERFQSVDAMMDDLSRWTIGEPVEARRAHRGYALRLLWRRHRRAVAALALVLTMLAAWGITLSAMYARQATLLAQVTQANDESQRVQRVLQSLLINVAEIGKGSDVALRREALDRAARAAEAELLDHPAAWAAAQDALGRTYQQLSLYDDAERYLRASLDARIALHGREHADVATALSHLGHLLRDRARGAQAEPLFREALALRQRLLGNEHPDVARSLYDVAMVLQFREEYDAAIDVHRRALAIQRRLPESRADVVLSLRGMGYAFFNLKNYPEAEKWFREALELQLHLTPEPHRDVAGCRIDLAKALQEIGRPDEAEPLLRAALGSFRTLLGSNHDNTAWAAHRLGCLLTARGEHSEAEPLLREALATYRRVLGDDTAYSAFVWDSLADLLLRTGRTAEALDAWREAERIFSRQPHQVIPLNRVRARLALLARSEPD